MKIKDLFGNRVFTRIAYWIPAALGLILALAGMGLTTQMFYSQSFANSFPIAIYHIESWTFGVFSSIEAGASIYRPIAEYNSPIYQPLPYYILYWLSQVTSSVFTLPQIGAARLVNTLLFSATLIGLFAFILVRQKMSAKAILLSLFFVALVGPLILIINHIGYAFPHETTKFYLFVFCLSVFCLELNSLGKVLLFVSVLTLAPWLRQTYFLMSAPLIFMLYYDLISRRKFKWLAISVAVSIAITAFTGAAILSTNDLPSMISWTLQLPAIHPRGLQYMPHGMIKYCLLNLAAALILVWSCRTQLKPFLTKYLVVLAIAGCFTALFHSSKMGSGIHMADTIVYPTLLMLSLWFSLSISKMSQLKYRWIAIILPLILLSLPSRNVFTGLKIDFSAATRSAKKAEDEKNRILQVLTENTSLDFTGYRLKQFPHTPLETSIIETEYANPPQDTGVPQIVNSLLVDGPNKIVTNLESDKLLYLPDRCVLTEKERLASIDSWIMHVDCKSSKQ